MDAPSLISLIVTVCLLLLSEGAAFVPVEANGVVHAVYLVLKSYYEKPVAPLGVEPPVYTPSIPDGFQRNMVIS
jgi:hypothetical protein